MSTHSCSSAAPAGTPRVGFVINHLLGFVTYADYWRRSLNSESTIAPEWMLIPPSAQDIWERVPQVTFRMGLRANSLVRRKKHQLDCLFMCTQVCALFSVDIMRRIPTVVSLDATPAAFDQIVEAYGGKPPGRVGAWVKRVWNRRIYNAAHSIIAWNDWTARSLVRDYGTNPDKVKTVYPGIDLSLWEPRPEGADTGDHRLRVLFVGGDFERKGGLELLEAVGALENVELDIVSDHPAAQPSDRVRVHRNLSANSDPLRSLFREAELFVLPTRGDTNPWVILEAMATGLPVISTNVGAVSEFVLDGETGLVVPPRATPALVEAIRSLAADPGRRSSMGRAGRARVESDFDMRNHAREVCEILRAAAGCRPGVSPSERSAA